MNTAPSNCPDKPFEGHALTVECDCMAPTIQRGDVVFFSPDNKVVRVWREVDFSDPLTESK